MRKPLEELAEYEGRELLDATGRRIGTIAGLGYPRRKFGMAWLLVETASGDAVFFPGDEIRSSDGRLALPYPKTYVEDAPTMKQGQPLSRAEERRLCLHYGLDSHLPNSACRQGCGLCMAERRAKRTR